MAISLLLLLTVLGVTAFPTPNHPPNLTKFANDENSRVEGDILWSDEDVKMMREKRGAPDVSDANKKWPIDQVISYKLVSSYDAAFAQQIRDAFKFWTENTCLTYQENGPTTPVIEVTKGKGCASGLGRKFGQPSQELNLDNGCNSVGTKIHEIGHSLGLGHTQMRADRDSYITINKNNIKQGAERNFDKLTANNNFGVEYDYSSVMHYAGDDFAIDPKVPVIKALDENAQYSMGQRDRAAFSDVKLVNLFYNCAQKCPSATMKCQNGGIINSKTCNSCICPPMFTGSDCSQRTPAKGKYASATCGADLTATSSWQNVKATFGAVAGEQYWDGKTYCYWNFKAPAGNQIEIRVNNPDIWCDETCAWNSVEFFMKGFASGSYRFCCPDKVKGKVFRSVDNGVSMLLAAAYSKPSIDLDYRLV